MKNKLLHVVHWCSYLIFLQCDLSHLSVAHEGARHLVHSLGCAHFYEVVGGEVAGLISHLSLKAEWTDPEFALGERTLENKQAEAEKWRRCVYVQTEAASLLLTHSPPLFIGVIQDCDAITRAGTQTRSQSTKSFATDFVFSNHIGNLKRICDYWKWS